MADNSDLQIKIVLDDGNVVQGFLNIEKKGQQSAKKLEDGFGGFSENISNKIKGIGVALAAAFTVNKVVDFFSASIKAASEAERANNALAASLAQINRFSSSALSEFNAYASQLQMTTGFSDDLIKQNAALLVSIGNLSGDKLKEATKASLDLSQALQIDAGTAFDVVAKAAAGNTGALGRYGIKIDESIPKSQKFAETLKTIQTRFGGLAETRLDTFEGALTNLSNSFGEIQEAIGMMFTSSGALKAFFNTISDALYKISENILKIQSADDIIGALMIKVVSFGLGINEYLIKPLELGFNFLMIGINTVKVAINSIIYILAGVSSALIGSIINPIQLLMNGLGTLVSFVDKDFGEKITASANNIANGIKEPFEVAAASTKEVLIDSFNELVDQTRTAFTGPMSGSIDQFLFKLQENMEKAKGVLTTFKKNNSETTSAIADDYKAMRDQINAAMQQGVVKIISGSIQSVGASLVKGASAFSGFKDFILNTLGDLAIQVGTLLISMGLGIEKLKIALASWNGFEAVAAGAALVALGGALKALSSGPGASAAAPSGDQGGGVSASPSTATELNQPTQMERSAPETKVQVVIQGDVLDSDSSGSRIVQLINDAFDKKGVVITQGAFA